MILGACSERSRWYIGEPVADKTRFGWTIIAQEIDYTALSLTQASQSDYEELCPPDVLGLTDSPDTINERYIVMYAQFREQQADRNEIEGTHPPLPTIEISGCNKLLTEIIEKEDGIGRNRQ